MADKKTFQLTIVIIGGGAAGMGCALWLKQLGFHPVIIESSNMLGGQASNIHRINRWVLGQWQRSSHDIAAIYADHIKRESISCNLNSLLINVKIPSHKLNTFQTMEAIIQTEGSVPESISAHALVIASGQKTRSEEVFQQQTSAIKSDQTKYFHYYPLDHLDQLENIKGQTVAVLGGGDNAYCTACDLAQHGAIVLLIMRGKARAQSRFQQDFQNSNQTVYENQQIVSFNELEDQVCIQLKGSDQFEHSLTVNKVFVRYGFVPQSEFIHPISSLNSLERDSSGYIRVDKLNRTSQPFIYAIGDITGLQPFSLVNAVAQGATAAHAIEQDLGMLDVS